MKDTLPNSDLCIEEGKKHPKNNVISFGGVVGNGSLNLLDIT